MPNPTPVSAAALLSRLKAEFGPDFFSQETSELLEYGKDWTKEIPPNPLVITFPRTTGEVSQLLQICSELKCAVVPSGGRTGLAGGAVAAHQEVVLSLERMNHLSAVDPLSRTLRAQAGAVTEAVHLHCQAQGLIWPVDFASKGSSTIGGNIATNAGGVNVIRYGLTRHWVLGLQVVLASGKILELNGALEKNNTGIDLRQLFIGSEGILGVITEATLKLAPVSRPSEVFLFAAESLESVLQVFEHCRRSHFTLNAFEFFTQRCLERVKKNLNLRSPFTEESNFYVLIDLEKPGDGAGATELEAWLEALLGLSGVKDGTMAQNSHEARNLWMLREGISESLSSTGTPHKNDVSLPISQLSGFCFELEAFFQAQYPDWEICLFGHIGDGNLHINVMKPETLSREDFKVRTALVDRDLFTLVRKHQGSISAEHGIGLLKKNFLSFSRSPLEIELFRSLKKALDPGNILNPGKIFDL
ncbi:MAG: FAD-binding oxidoreductase [Methylotenera sp.]|nr:FAD-binding oxidoreductase [Oligoflexia bacterium]